MLDHVWPMHELVSTWVKVDAQLPVFPLFTAKYNWFLNNDVMVDVYLILKTIKLRGTFKNYPFPNFTMR